jgi:hypothetical protein
MNSRMSGLLRGDKLAVSSKAAISSERDHEKIVFR